MVLDRYSAYATGRKRYFLRPIWDARRAVRVLPGGACELVWITVGRRMAASLLLIDEVEDLISRWGEPKTGAPARLPRKAGALGESLGINSRA
jgi:hypothetical protein